jgi:hypothetical protein
MGCCQGEECPEPLERLTLELALQGPQVPLVPQHLEWLERPALPALELLGPEPRQQELGLLELEPVPLALQPSP